PTTATIFAVGTGDTKGESKDAVKVDKITEKIGSMLGASPGDIAVNDLKVNPSSGNLFLSVTRGKGQDAMPALVKLDRTGKLTQFELKDVPCASVKLGKPGGKQPGTALTALAYANGKVYVAGLSAEEFNSNFRVIPFPFADKADKGSSTEIYHGAHG